MLQTENEPQDGYIVIMLLVAVCWSQLAGRFSLTACNFLNIRGTLVL